MASTALSMLPCAVIITTAGRSASGVDAASSRMTSSPVRSGIRKSITSRSNERSLSSARRLLRVRRGDHLVPVVAQRAAQRLEDFLFVVGEQDAAGHVMCHCSVRVARAHRRCRCGSRCRRRHVVATLIVPPRPSTMFLAIARPRPVPARRVVKYGSKMRGRSSSAMPLPVIANRDRRRGDRRSFCGDQRDAAAGRPLRGSIACSRVGQQVDQHGAQPLAVGDELGQRRRQARARPGRCAGRRSPPGRHPGRRR